jgi:hypothetical protein
MLDITATMEGNRVVIDGISGFARSTPDALKRGLRSSARGIYAEAHKNLEGPGRTPVKTHGGYKWRATGYQREGKTRLRGQHSFLGARPGSSPVPIITGNLIGRLGILEPGESLQGEGDIGTFSAADNEFIIYDSASYAYVIRDARGSSSKYKPRDFIGDGLKTYDGTVGITTPVEEELGKEIDKI